jgi:hypothetical protein
MKTSPPFVNLSPASAMIAAVMLMGCGCSQRMVLGDNPDAHGSGGSAATGGGAGTGGMLGTAGGSGTSGTGGAPGTAGRGGGGAGRTGSGGGVGGGSGGPGTGGGAPPGSGGRGGSTGASGGMGPGGASGPGGATGGGCGGDDAAGMYCVTAMSPNDAGGISCGDVAVLATCSAGAWTCPAGTMSLSRCTCSTAAPTGCSCTASGWICPDGGVADAGTCDFGCSPRRTTVCASRGKIDWLCTSQTGVSTLKAAGCEDPGIDVTLFCCDSAFMGQCPATP